MLGHRPRKIFLMLLTSVAILLAAPAVGRSFDLNLAVGGGYDDNPLELKGTSGSAFTEAQFNGSQTFQVSALPATAFTIQGFAGARLYDKVDDTWMASGELSSATNLGFFPGQIEFFTRLTTFNNPEIDDDDFDQLKIGGRIAWFVSPRLTFEWENFLAWEEYDYDRRVTGSSGGSGNGAKTMRKDRPHPDPSPPGHRPRHHNRGERDDRVLGTALRGLVALNPYWDASGEIFWQTRHSSLDAEKNHSYGLELGLFWHPLEKLELTLVANAARTPYHYDFKQESHTEKSYGSTINLNWKFTRHWSLSGSWEWYRQDSDVGLDDYTRNQWYTRVNFSY